MRVGPFAAAFHVVLPDALLLDDDGSFVGFQRLGRIQPGVGIVGVKRLRWHPVPDAYDFVLQRPGRCRRRRGRPGRHSRGWWDAGDEVRVAITVWSAQTCDRCLGGVDGVVTPVRLLGALRLVARRDPILEVGDRGHEFVIGRRGAPIDVRTNVVMEGGDNTGDDALVLMGEEAPCAIGDRAEMVVDRVQLDVACVGPSDAIEKFAQREPVLLAREALSA